MDLKKKNTSEIHSVFSYFKMAGSLPDDVWLLSVCRSLNSIFVSTTERRSSSFNNIRPCEIYKEEYKDCKAFLSRLYQHYIDGQRSNCAVWLTDFENCMKFRNNKDLQAAEAILESERQRRKIRLQNAKANDVWEYRKAPPAGWFAPLDSE